MVIFNMKTSRGAEELEKRHVFFERPLSAVILRRISLEAIQIICDT